MIAAKILMLILSNEGHWFGGQAGTISAQWAAQFEQPEAVLKWDLLIGEVCVAGDQLAVQRGSKASVVTVTPPEVRARTRMRWVYHLYQRGDGKEIDAGEAAVQVYPAPKADRLKDRLPDRRIAVWDTAGGLADALSKAGLEFRRIRKAADLQLSRVDVVLVGPDELRHEVFDQSPLIALAEAGAGVVLFEQRRPRSLAGYALMRRTASIRPTWRGNHPLMSGLEVDDVQSWLGGPGKEIWAVELPADEPVLEIGHWPPVVEGPRPGPVQVVLAVKAVGKGRMIVSQIPLGPWDTDPRTQQFLDNVLGYLGTRPEPTPRPSERQVTRPVASQPVPTIAIPSGATP
ncbi:MAG: hypothetical protein JW955_05020 [Sedimentisphaerales bacterium]|nr:hypothetical protein [Sedimentisphaerales bacterium]